MQSNESMISTHDVLNGGTIELWKINGFHCVKSFVRGVITWSECVSKWQAEYFVFDATYYGNLEF